MVMIKSPLCWSAWTSFPEARASNGAPDFTETRAQRWMMIWGNITCVYHMYIYVKSMTITHIIHDSYVCIYTYIYIYMYIYIHILCIHIYIYIRRYTYDMCVILVETHGLPPAPTTAPGSRHRQSLIPLWFRRHRGASPGWVDSRPIWAGILWLIGYRGLYYLGYHFRSPFPWFGWETDF